MLGSSADIFNCTFEPAYTIEEIVKTIKKVTGLTQAVPYVPNAVIMPAAAADISSSGRLRRQWRIGLRITKGSG